MTTKEIATFLNIPPHKLGDDAKTSYSSLEQENQSYLESGLGIWLSRIEAESWDKLFLEDEKRDYFTEFLREARLRADTETRYNVYSVAIAARIMSPNEARILENMNPYEGGDVYENPNITPSTPTTTETNSTEIDQSDVIASRDVLEMQLHRSIERLCHKARNASKRPDKFLGWLNGIEQDHEVALRQMLGRVCALAARFNNLDSEELQSRLIDWAFDSFREEMLQASECHSDQLLSRVADAHTVLRSKASHLASQLVIRGEVPWNGENV